MSSYSLNEMGLSAEHARTAASFLTAYANTALAELEERMSAAPEPGGGPPRLDEDQFFRQAADGATALREAAQWALFLDPPAATALLRRSGSLFLQLREPFGAYLLLVGGAGPDELWRPVISTVEAMNARAQQRAAEDDGALHARHPQQQAYLLLAASSLVGANGDPDPSLRTMLETSPHRDGAAPVGALGTPISRYWAIARHLLSGGPESMAEIGTHLSAMADRYAETMHSAQASEYLWQQGLSPVDVGDIDIAGITSLTARRFGSAFLEELASRLDAVASAPILAGIELAFGQSGPAFHQF